MRQLRFSHLSQAAGQVRQGSQNNQKGCIIDDRTTTVGNGGWALLRPSETSYRAHVRTINPRDREAGEQSHLHPSLPEGCPLGHNPNPSISIPACTQAEQTAPIPEGSFRSKKDTVSNCGVERSCPARLRRTLGGLWAHGAGRQQRLLQLVSGLREHPHPRAYLPERAAREDTGRQLNWDFR